jgi:hypothetical protein
MAGWETGPDAVNLFWTKKQPPVQSGLIRKDYSMNRHVNMTDLDLRQDLAAAFRWTARLNLH